jgi:hypothetical protein
VPLARRDGRSARRARWPLVNHFLIVVIRRRIITA